MCSIYFLHLFYDSICGLTYGFCLGNRHCLYYFYFYQILDQILNIFWLYELDFGPINDKTFQI